MYCVRVISMREAMSDIAGALQKYHLATTFGWQDVAQRYRRSRVGAFWLTINMGVLIGALGLIFGTLFRAQMSEFLPFLCVGLIVWGFVSSALNEGCSSFISAEGIILQVRMPLFTHVMRTLWRNAIILGHNLIIYPIVFLAFGRMPTWHAVLAIPGFALLALNILWMMLVLAVLCARFRDMNQIVSNVLQVVFFATPVMWMPSTLPEHASKAILYLNPFYHLIAIVRAPLMGEMLEWQSWAFACGLALFGWALALVFFGRYRRRVPYWL